MRKLLIAVLINIVFAGYASLAGAGERGTAAEAEAMVKKAIAYMKMHGNQKAFAEFQNPKGQFVDRDLYVWVADLNGTTLAHGANPKLANKNLIEFKDVDGKYFVKERVELAKTKENFWHDYKYFNPATKKIENKSAYVERTGDLIVGSGIYKP